MTQKKKNLAAGISCGVLLLLCISVCLEVPEKIRDRNRITVGVFSDSYWNVQNGYSYRILNDAIQKFRERYPDVEVEYESGILKEDYSEWLAEKLISGDAPDVFLVLPEDFNDLTDTGAVRELTDFVEKDEKFEQDAFYSSAWETGNYEQNQYTIPYECAPKLMFVNKTILDRENIPLPQENWNWNDFYAICKQVTRDTDGDGVVDQYGVTGYTWEDAFESNGVQLFNQNGTAVNFTGKKVREGITFMERLRNLNGEYSPTSRDFDKGNVAFQPMSFAEYRAYKSYPLSVKKYSGFDWECISMPAGAEGGNVSRLDTLSVAMNRKTRHPEYAWEFIKTLTFDPEIQAEIFSYSEGVSVLREVTESAQTLNQLLKCAGNSRMNIEILTEVVEQAVVSPRFRDADRAIAEVDKAVEAIIEGSGNISMEQIIWNRGLNKELNK